MNNEEEWISVVEIKIMEITQTNNRQKAKWKKHESNIRDLWINIKQGNLHIIGIPGGEEKEKGIENIFEEIMAENYPNLKETISRYRKHRGPQTSWTQTDPHQEI